MRVDARGLIVHIHSIMLVIYVFTNQYKYKYKYDILYHIYIVHNMKYIQTMLTRLFVKEEKKVLGRWSIDHCDRKLNNKIDLSNEDHCGPCGQYILKKSFNHIITKTK